MVGMEMTALMVMVVIEVMAGMAAGIQKMEGWWVILLLLLLLVFFFSFCCCCVVLLVASTCVLPLLFQFVSFAYQMTLISLSLMAVL